jgi:hypothetical protein
MEKLELIKGEDIPYPVFLAPNVLSKKPIYGGITIEGEEEIILGKPERISMKEKEVQVELVSERISELEKKIEKLNEILEIYRKSDALSFDVGSIDSDELIKVLKQHPDPLYHLFYTRQTDQNESIDFSMLGRDFSKISCLFFGVSGKGSLELAFNKDQLENIKKMHKQEPAAFFPAITKKIYASNNVELIIQQELETSTHEVVDTSLPPLSPEK